MMPAKNGIDKDIGSSYAWCGLWVGIGLAVYGIVYAVLAYAGMDEPFGVAAVGMVVAVMGYFTLVGLWFIVRAFKTFNVLLLAVSAALALFLSIRSIIIPLCAHAPGSSFRAVILAAFTDSPVPILLVVTGVLAAALIKPAKKRSA
jgi:hypothetical protein